MASAVASPFRYSHTIGVMAHGGRGFSNPVDLALAPGDIIYVLNRSNPVQGPPPMGGLRIGILNVNEDYLGFFGSYGTGEGQFIWPTAIALDSQGRIYVADEYRHDVQVFDREGHVVGRWGGLGEQPGQFNRPSGLAIDRHDNVFVVDHFNQRVQKVTTEGQPLAAWGSRGSDPGQFELPWGCGVDSEGNLYVADWGNDRVQKFDNQGRFLASYGSPGSGEGQVKRPASATADDDGNVYVADWGNERVVVFREDGSHLATLIGDATMSKWGQESLEGNPDLVIARKDVDLEPEKRLWGPTSVKVDALGRVFIVDSCRHRLQIYQRNR